MINLWAAEWHSMKFWLKLFHLIAYTLAVLSLGYLVGHYLIQPQPVEIIKEVPILINVPVLVEVPVVKEVPIYQTLTLDRPVEKIVYTNICSRRWESIQQFVDWYQAQNFTAIWVVGDRLADCNDYAVEVQERALEQGYPVSIALTTNGYYLTTKVSDIAETHAGLLILVGKDYYWIEPQPQRFSYTKVAERP